MFNIGAIMGRMADNAELRQTQKGTKITMFCVAVDRGYTKKGEERKTDWIDCVACGQTAEFVTKYFTKGQMIAVVGHYQTRTYKDKNGVSRKAVELFADNVNFCGSKNDGGAVNTQPDPLPQQNSTAPAYQFNVNDYPEIPVYEDDLPF